MSLAHGSTAAVNPLSRVLRCASALRVTAAAGPCGKLPAGHSGEWPCLDWEVAPPSVPVPHDPGGLAVT